jgi:phosphoenolpyruvate synthase/pyruvate phosphate dikinase
LAKEAEFFSFGTNDLTQMILGSSRDDYDSFRKDYEARKIWTSDPFAVLDQEGVGALVKMAVESGRKTRADLEVGFAGNTPANLARCNSAMGRKWIMFLVPITAYPFRSWWWHRRLL